MPVELGSSSLVNAIAWQERKARKRRKLMMLILDIFMILRFREKREKNLEKVPFYTENVNLCK